jgi:3-oxoadipate enol-lactonase
VPHTEASGVRIHWEEHGRGEPLLLVMGYGLSGDAWIPLLPALRGFRVIRFDNRGTGDSGPCGDGFTIETMAGDAAAVLDDAGVQRAHLHGVSMGGMISLSLVLAHPDRVGALVLGCTTASPLRFAAKRPEALELARAATLMGSDPEAALDRLLPLVFSERFLRENPSIRDLGRALATAPVHPEAAMRTMRAMADLGTGRAFDVAGRLGEIRALTLVQHGSDDRLIPVEAGRALAREIPGAEYQELEGAGHAYATERPMEALGRMLGFLAEHPLERASRA